MTMKGVMMEPTYLGQLVPAFCVYQKNAFSADDAIEICEDDCYKAGIKIQLYVASGNAMKVAAAEKAVKVWADYYFEKHEMLPTQKFEVSSDVPEQPQEDSTYRGAQNRLEAMKKQVDLSHCVGKINVFISMENGIFREVVNNMKNPAVFQEQPGEAWVDRCFVLGEVNCCGGKKVWPLAARSIGVTTPLKAVLESFNSKLKITAGSFIAKEYGWDAKDWHKSIAGMPRQEIMYRAICRALNIEI
jgi:Protein of unknown function DUF84